MFCVLLYENLCLCFLHLKNIISMWKAGKYFFVLFSLFEYSQTELLSYKCKTLRLMQIIFTKICCCCCCFCDNKINFHLIVFCFLQYFPYFLFSFEFLCQRTRKIFKRYTWFDFQLNWMLWFYALWRWWSQFFGTLCLYLGTKFQNCIHTYFFVHQNSLYDRRHTIGLFFVVVPIRMFLSYYLINVSVTFFIRQCSCSFVAV